MAPSPVEGVVMPLGPAQLQPEPAELESALAEAAGIARYWLSAQLVSGKRVLDVGCGVGEGSATLATAGATEVVGVDAGAAVIEVAQAAERPNLRFEQANLDRLGYPDESFDVVACFDVIDRVDDAEATLSELARVLAPDGVLLISWSPEHPAQDWITRRWPHVRLLSQERWLASAVLNPPEPVDQVRVLRTDAEWPPDRPHTIALASAVALPDPAPVAAVSGTVDAQAWLQRWDARRRELDAQRVRIEELGTIERERDELRARLIEAEGKIQRTLQLEADLEQANWRRDYAQGQVEGLQSQLDAVSQILDDVVSSPSWRLTRPLRAMKQWLRRG